MLFRSKQLSRNPASIRRYYSAFTKSAIPSSELGNPFVPFKRFIDEAKQQNNQVTNEFSMATVTKDNKPDNRFMIAKEVNEDGTLIFYTNQDSALGEELQNNPNVSCNFYWPDLGRSARVRGQVEHCTKEESNEYWKSRSMEKQANAVVSNQGDQLQSKEGLEEKVEQKTKEAKEAGGLNRPDDWHGYRVWCDSIELWAEGEAKANMHNRIQWDRQIQRKGKDPTDAQGFKAGEWSHKLLQP